MAFWSGKHRQNRAAQGPALESVRLLAAPATLPVAAQQHLVRQICGVCHNYEDYAGGVQFEVSDASKLYEKATLTARLLPADGTLLEHSRLLSILGMFDVQAERFGDSTAPLQSI